MNFERRHADRVTLPPDVEAAIGGVSVRVLNLSAIGAFLEHSDRFPTAGARLELRWRDVCADVGIRLVRTEITGRNGARFVYRTGVHFTDADPLSEGVIATILRAGLSEGSAPPDANDAPVPRDEDTWTRTVNFLQEDRDDDLPYMRFRMTPSGWMKEYVADGAQPEDGFTLARTSANIDEAVALQRTFERADATMRQRLRRAIDAKIRESGGK